MTPMLPFSYEASSAQLLDLVCLHKVAFDVVVFESEQIHTLREDCSSTLLREVLYP